MHATFLLSLLTKRAFLNCPHELPYHRPDVACVWPDLFICWITLPADLKNWDFKKKKKKEEEKDSDIQRGKDIKMIFKFQ